MKIQANLKIITGLLLLGLLCGVALAAPSPVTGLSATAGETWIKWTWANPSEDNFSHTEVYIDGVKGDLENPEEYNATGLTAETSYEIGIRTVDTGGNFSDWKNDTFSTKAPAATPAQPVANFTVNTTSGEAPLTVQFTDASVNATNLEWDFDGDGNVDVNDEKNPKYTYTEEGTYTAKLKAINGTESDTFEKVITVGEATTPAQPVANFTVNTTSGEAPLTVQFTDASVNATNLEWDFDGDGNVDVNNEKTPKYTYTEEGTYTAKLKAINGTESDTFEKVITITGSSPDTSIKITAYQPEMDDEELETIVVGGSREFNITINQACTVTWIVDGEEEDPEDAVEKDGEYFSSFNYTFDEIKDYNITAIAKNETTDKETLQIWNLTVVSENYYKGNRIWDENAGLSDEYTWDYLSYSGFFYDLDSGLGSESMTISDISDGNIEENDLVYTTVPIETDFEYNDWGSYQVIGFMAEKYFAGFEEDKAEPVDDDVSLIDEGVLSKVLTDSDDKESIYSGSELVLGEGYSLNIVEVDVNGDTVWVQLEKDGDVVEDQFLSSGEDFVYETDLGGAEDVPIIIAHFGTVFAGAETSAVFVEGIFQISDNYLEIERGDEFGEMEVTSMSSTKIEMKNKEDDIDLKKGDIIDLMGKIKIQVADDNDLRFAPILDMSEAGTYELRGTVYDEEEKPILKWTPLNFEGFYYNIDEGIGTETLEITDLNGNEIPENGLVYSTTAEQVEFEHEEWGEFQVIGFMAEKYFAGFTEENATFADDDISLLDENILSKVLIDSDEKESMYSGSALVLEDGYSLEIKEVDINGDVVWVQLQKDGDDVEDQFLSSGETYVYEGDLGDAEDIPQIIIDFGTVFAGAETSAVFVEGIFQISEDYIEVENGDAFGEMEISSIDDDSLEMKNKDDDISLDEGDTIDIMGNIKFKVADPDEGNTLRFYPFVEVETEGDGSASRELRISVPDEIIVDESFEIEVTADGEEIEGVSVKLGGKSIGKTDSDGTLSYTSSASGDFKLTAEKEGYTAANKNIEILEQKEKMSITVSPSTAYKGDELTIEIVNAIGGDAVEGAEVSVEGESIGETDSDGTVSYTADEAGRLQIAATKEGFLDESINFNVKELEAKFVYSNLVVPAEIKAGKEAEISIDVQNDGNAAGETNVDLIVNGSAAGSQTISLGIGESTTVTFSHSEEVPGQYEVEIGDQSSTYEVTKKGSALLYVLIVLILALGGGAAYMFTKGGWTVDKVMEAIGKKPQE